MLNATITEPLSSSVNSSDKDEKKLYRQCSQSHEPAVLTDIYKEEVNLAVWQHQLPSAILDTASRFIKANPTFKTSITVTPQGAFSSLRKLLSSTDDCELSKHIAELVDMFCMLFELDRAGLRLTVLNAAMCPKFHVDHVPCRLITTLYGAATQWLPHEHVDRAKLGHGSNGLPDHQSGLFTNPQDIEQLNCGDVALLKGERWEGNENAGLVHRSPALSPDEKRLILTLDFIN